MAVVLGIIVLNFTALAVMFSERMPSALASQSWSEGFLSHTAMWVVSLILILILSRGKPRAYGFCIGKGYRWWQIVAPALIIGALLATTQHLLPSSSVAVVADYSFIETVAFIWVYASVAEELLTRGLIQGFLSPLTDYGFSIFRIRISLPVVVSALFFGLMHLALLTTGMAVMPVLATVVCAGIVGFIAGYQRELTGSMIPAILVHAFANVGGTLMEMLIS